MQTEQIVALLIAERNRLNLAIQALQDPVKRRGRPSGTTVIASPVHKPPTHPVHKRTLSSSARKAMAAAAKKRWAAIKAGKAPNPFAKGKAQSAKKS